MQTIIDAVRGVYYLQEKKKKNKKQKYNIFKGIYEAFWEKRHNEKPHEFDLDWSGQYHTNIAMI